ncbi:MAG TPA: hypothetical protein VF457_10030, partial [Burkholderiaceae bacterium]
MLLNWPGVPAWRIGGELWIDRKFKDGQDMFARYWPGRVKALMEIRELDRVPAFGAHRWTGEGEAWDLALLQPGESFAARHVAGVDVLLANADSPSKLVAPAVCGPAGVACVFSIEYTLRTRLDMLRHTPMRPLKRLKTFAWLLMNERRVRRAVAASDGVQANGLAAFDAYGRAHRLGLAYWDTRLAAGAVIA